MNPNCGHSSTQLIVNASWISRRMYAKYLPSLEDAFGCEKKEEFSEGIVLKDDLQQPSLLSVNPHDKKRQSENILYQITNHVPTTLSDAICQTSQPNCESSIAKAKNDNPLLPEILNDYPAVFNFTNENQTDNCYHILSVPTAMSDEQASVCTSQDPNHILSTSFGNESLHSSSSRTSLKNSSPSNLLTATTTQTSKSERSSLVCLETLTSTISECPFAMFDFADIMSDRQHQNGGVPDVHRSYSKPLTTTTGKRNKRKSNGTKKMLRAYSKSAFSSNGCRKDVSGLQCSQQNDRNSAQLQNNKDEYGRLGNTKLSNTSRDSVAAIMHCNSSYSIPGEINYHSTLFSI